MLPWNDWYHVMCHTYGTWLPGDPRGFRTRHHREHVEGDYKSPPPLGKYAGLHRKSAQLMTREAIYLMPMQISRAVEEIVKSLGKWNIPLKIASIDRVHLHLLLQCRDRNPRHWVGLAKKESSAYMKRKGLAPAGGLWATRCECIPVRDASHFENAAGYIREHEKHGAVICERDISLT